MTEWGQNHTGKHPCHHWEVSMGVLSYQVPVRVHVICVMKPWCLYSSTEHSVVTYPGQRAATLWAWATLSGAAIFTALIDCPFKAEDRPALCYRSFFICVITCLSLLLNTWAFWVRGPALDWVCIRGAQGCRTQVTKNKIVALFLCRNREQGPAKLYLPLQLSGELHLPE